MTVAATITPQFTSDSCLNQPCLSQLDHSEWDVVVLGAGVAGASAAILAARSGYRTLLVEAKSFPREKVCGGCLNRRAQASLERLGVLEKLYKAGAVPITELHLRIAKTSVVWKIPTLLSVRRSTLDAELVRAAVEAGAIFVDNVSGFVMPRLNEISSSDRFRHVTLQHSSSTGEQHSIVTSKCILVADGLTRSSLRKESGWLTDIQPSSRIGVQRMVPASLFERQTISRGQLHMIVTQDGYVGLSHTDGSYLDLAGAIDPKSIAKYGGIARTIDNVLGNGIRTPMVCSVPSETLGDSPGDWLATPALTRRSRQVASDRVFLLGDSIGYVEPFTGEGMSWALASAEAVMPIVGRTLISPWDASLPQQWTRWVQLQQKRKQKTCWWISRQLRRLTMAAWTLRLCNTIYPIREALIKKVTS